MGLAGGSDIPKAREKTAGPAPSLKGKVTVPLLCDYESYLPGGNKRRPRVRQLPWVGASWRSESAERSAN